MDSKFDKLASLREKVKNVEKEKTIIPVVNKETFIPQENIKPTVDNNKSETISNEPIVSLSKSDLNEVGEAKANGLINKKKVLKKTTTAVTKTSVNPDLLFEISCKLKKEKVFITHFNNYLYEKLLSNKEFFKQIIEELKETDKEDIK